MAETINTQTTGYECVGIEKIEQTYEGLFDNKPNIITIYLTNGDTHQFKVMNGSQGVGIDRIEQRQTSTVSGGRNEFAIILTNGKEYTFSTYNGSGGSGSSGSFNQVLQQLNNLLMPSGKSYLYYNGSGFEWKSPDGSTGGGTSIDLSEYSWWGRKFDPASKSITGEMSSVTGIEFQSTKGETVIRKKLHLDKNGDLCFDGNLYATGGITALGSGGSTSGGSSASLGTLLTKLNSDNPFPTTNGQILTYDGSNFVWKTFTESGVALNPTMDAMNRGLTKTSYGTPQFLYWDGSKYTWKNESEISGNGGSIQVAQTPEYAGESENWVSTTKLRFVGITGTKPTIRTNSEKSCVDVGIPVGGGSGSSGTTAGKLYFRKDTDSYSEAYWNGESNFRIIFGSGLNVSWDSTTQITLSATGGSSTGGSVDLSNYLTKTEASRNYAAKSHTHSAASITGFEDAVKLIKVNNADKATQLANSRVIWGQRFNGTGDINGNLYMGTAGGGSVQLWMNSGNMLDRTNNTLHIGYGLKESSDGEMWLDANTTRVYTDNMSKHYDFKSNVFDVNSNQIHFGSETNGGTLSWDSANKCFKINGSVYATGGITALGVSNNATTSNNVDFTFKSVSITGNNNVQLTDGGLSFVYRSDGAVSTFYGKNSIGLYDEYNDECCTIFDFGDSRLTFDSENYQYDIVFNKGISCSTNENTLDVGTNGSIGYIKFYPGSTMTFEYNNINYSFNVAKAIEQGILTI